MAIIEVSPTDPGMLPINASNHEKLSLKPCKPPSAAYPKGVAPLKPSGVTPVSERPAIQTLSPESCDGYAKYKNARPVNAGFKKFLPVPPKTSLPITIPNVIPMAACHRGKSGGQLKANKIEDTNNPSFISCLRTTAKRISQRIPTANVTA